MSLPVVLLVRVRWPMAGWPQGVLGGMPVGDLPSPPPCGWSRGFIDHAAHLGPAAHVPRATGLAEALVLVVEVADLADRGHAAHVDPADLARGQSDLGVVALLGHQLGGGTRASGRSGRPCRARARCCGCWCRAGWRAAAGRCRRGPRALAPATTVSPTLQALGHEDVALLAVRVVEQADARRAVGVVLDRREARGHVPLVALEVDAPVVALRAAAAVAHGHASLLVAAGCRASWARASGLWGVSVVISSKVERVMNRRPGEVGL